MCIIIPFLFSVYFVYIVNTELF